MIERIRNGHSQQRRSATRSASLRNVQPIWRKLRKHYRSRVRRQCSLRPDRRIRDLVRRDNTFRTDGSSTSPLSSRIFSQGTASLAARLRYRQPRSDPTAPDRRAHSAFTASGDMAYLQLIFADHVELLFRDLIGSTIHNTFTTRPRVVFQSHAPHTLFAGIRFPR